MERFRRTRDEVRVGLAMGAVRAVPARSRCSARVCSLPSLLGPILFLDFEPYLHGLVFHVGSRRSREDRVHLGCECSPVLPSPLCKETGGPFSSLGLSSVSVGLFLAHLGPLDTGGPRMVAQRQSSENGINHDTRKSARVPPP